MNLFQRHKIESGLTYKEIGEAFNPPVQRGTACKFVMEPGRCYPGTITKLIDILGIPKDEAEKEWKEARIIYKAEKVNNESL